MGVACLAEAHIEVTTGATAAGLLQARNCQSRGPSSGLGLSASTALRALRMRRSCASALWLGRRHSTHAPAKQRAVHSCSTVRRHARGFARLWMDQASGVQRFELCHGAVASLVKANNRYSLSNIVDVVLNSMRATAHSAHCAYFRGVGLEHDDTSPLVFEGSF